jgi:hypothetical protein
MSLYALNGAVFLAAGGSVLLLGTDLLPPQVREVIDSIGHEDPNTLHIMQEFGSLLIFAGLITFWFIWHYKQSRAFHWAMTLFWALIALVHLVDVRGSFDLDIGTAINAIPFALFVIVGVLRMKAEGILMRPR